jgi:hypothetical protein
MLSTTLEVNQLERAVSFVDRRSFVLGETYNPILISGILGADLPSLAIFLYAPDTGTLLAGSFNVTGSTPITKTLDRYSTTINFLSANCITFFGATPPETKDAWLIIRDENLVFCKQLVPIRYAPVLNAAPEPELPAISAAIAEHNNDPDAHLNLISKADVAGIIKFNLLDDSANFTDLCTVVNNLIDALQAPRA